jgi:hypothetical protein
MSSETRSFSNTNSTGLYGNQHGNPSVQFMELCGMELHSKLKTLDFVQTLQALTMDTDPRK